MAGWVEQYWRARDTMELPRRDRRAGTYSAYVPDPLCGRPLTLALTTEALAVRAEREVMKLGELPGSDGLAGLSRLLLRSEAIASSLIEGIAPSAQQVALAELAQDETIKGFSDHARLVANNVTVLRAASIDLVSQPTVTVADIVELHSSLLPQERHHGLRNVQNWIGGSNWHPLDAAFVPPPYEQVPALMDDLASCLSGASHAPLIHAALVHAQFETIHPFTDGNGRVGRALIHTVLARRKLTRDSVLPVSMVLATRSESYINGLRAYAYAGGADSREASEAIAAWLDVFLEAAIAAAGQARRIAGEIVEMRAEWTARLAASRAPHRTPQPRAGSATATLLGRLTEIPVLTVATAQRVFGLSSSAARSGLEELVAAGILRRKAVRKGTTGYIASDVLDLVSYAERRLVSAAFDTTVSRPVRPVPARPERG